MNQRPKKVVPSPEREFIDFHYVWQLAEETARFDRLMRESFTLTEVHEMDYRVRKQLRLNGIGA